MKICYQHVKQRSLSVYKVQFKEAMYSIYFYIVLETFSERRKCSVTGGHVCSIFQATIMDKIPWDSHAKLVIIDDLTITPKSSAGMCFQH